jgi:hypothetical protein
LVSARAKSDFSCSRSRIGADLVDLLRARARSSANSKELALLLGELGLALVVRAADVSAQRSFNSLSSRL